MGTKSKTQRAGVFDIRVVIALLIGAYGMVITVLGLGFTTDEEIERSAGVNVNLWAGVGMLLFAAGFIAWALLRPVEVPRSPAEALRWSPRSG